MAIQTVRSLKVCLGKLGSASRLLSSDIVYIVVK